MWNFAEPVWSAMDGVLNRRILTLLFMLFYGGSCKLKSGGNSPENSTQVLKWATPKARLIPSEDVDLNTSASGDALCVGKNGFYADPTHLCSVYYLCSPDGSRVIFECPPGQKFDTTDQACLNETLVLCVEETRFLTPMPRAKKLRALDQPPSLSTSQEQLEAWKSADHLAMESDITELVHTVMPNVQSSSMTPLDSTEYFSSLHTRIGGIFSKQPPAVHIAPAASDVSTAVVQRTPGSFDCQGRKGYFADVTQRCNIYFYCDPSTGKALKFQCPLDLSFDRAEQACVYPHKMVCAETLDDNSDPQKKQLGVSNNNVQQPQSGFSMQSGSPAFATSQTSSFSGGVPSGGFQSSGQSFGQSQSGQQSQGGFASTGGSSASQSSGGSSFGSGQQSGQFSNTPPSGNFGQSFTTQSVNGVPSSGGGQQSFSSNQQVPGQTSYSGGALPAGGIGLSGGNIGQFGTTQQQNVNGQQGTTSTGQFGSQQGFTAQYGSQAGQFGGAQGGGSAFQAPFGTTAQTYGGGGGGFAGQPATQAPSAQIQVSGGNQGASSGGTNTLIQQGSYGSVPIGTAFGNSAMPVGQPAQSFGNQNAAVQNTVQQPPPQYPVLAGGSGGYGAAGVPAPSVPAPVPAPVFQPTALPYSPPPAVPQYPPPTQSYSAPPSAPQYTPAAPSYSPAPFAPQYPAPAPQQPVYPQQPAPQPSPRPVVPSVPYQYPQTIQTQQPYQPPSPAPVQPAQPNIPFPQQPSYPVLGPSGGYGAPPGNPVAPSPPIFQPTFPAITTPRPAPPPVAPPAQPTYPVLGPSGGYGGAPPVQQPAQPTLPIFSTPRPTVPAPVYPQPQPNLQPQPQQPNYPVLGPAGGYGAPGAASAFPSQPNSPASQPVFPAPVSPAPSPPQAQQTSYASVSGSQPSGIVGSGQAYQSGSGQTLPPGALAGDEAPATSLTSPVVSTPAPPMEGVSHPDPPSTTPSTRVTTVQAPSVGTASAVPAIPQIDSSCNGLARGFYPIPGCRKYFYCSTFGERLNYTCQAGMMWNTLKGLCEDETKVVCPLPAPKNVTGAFVLTIRVHSNTKKHLQNAFEAMQGDDAAAEAFACAGRTGNIPEVSSGCRVFFHCSGTGRAERHQCADNMAFSVDQDICVPSDVALCSNTTQNVLTTTGTSTSRTTVLHISTLPSTVPVNGPLGSSSVRGQSFACKGLPPGRYANIEDECNSFWICDETEIKKHQNCPNGLLFDNTVQACDAPGSVVCSGPKIEAREGAVGMTVTGQPGIIPISSPTSGFNCQGQSGFFADSSTDCRTYHYCAKDGKSYNFTCPLNYRYSEVKEACDSPDTTPCKTRLLRLISMQDDSLFQPITTPGTTSFTEMLPQASHHQPVFSDSASERNLENRWFRFTDTETRRSSEWNPFVPFSNVAPIGRIFGVTRQGRPSPARFQDRSGNVPFSPIPGKPRPSVRQTSSLFLTTRSPFEEEFQRRPFPDFRDPERSGFFRPSQTPLVRPHLENFDRSPLDPRILGPESFVHNQNFDAHLNMPVNAFPKSMLFGPEQTSSPVQPHFFPNDRNAELLNSPLFQPTQLPFPQLNSPEPPESIFRLIHETTFGPTAFPPKTSTPQPPHQFFVTTRFPGQFEHFHPSAKFLENSEMVKQQVLTTFATRPFEFTNSIAEVDRQGNPGKSQLFEIFPTKSGFDIVNPFPARPTEGTLEDPFPTRPPPTAFRVFSDDGKRTLDAAREVQDRTSGPDSRLELTFTAPFPSPTPFQQDQFTPPPTIFFPSQQQLDCPLGRIGYFPDLASSCRNYVHCDGRGGRTDFNCPPGMAFNSSLVACDLEMFVLCENPQTAFQRFLTTTTPAPPRNSCFGRPTGYYADFSSGCRDYFFCSPAGASGISEKMEFTCPADFLFDEYRGVCVENGQCNIPDQGLKVDQLDFAASNTQEIGRFPRQFDISWSHTNPDGSLQLTLPALPEKQKDETVVPCKEHGKFADFDSGCTGFWHCEAPFLFAKFVKCPSGSLFDSISKQCIAPFLVQCLPAAEPVQKKGATLKFNCAGKPTGFYADLAESCRKFHHCTSEGDIFSYTCPFDWVFSEKLGECVQPENHSCPVFAISKYNDFNCFGKSGYYADYGQHCQIFHLCRLNGSRTTMSCPPAMVFDENEAKCVYGTVCVQPLPPTEMFETPFGAGSAFPRIFECPPGATGYFGDPLYACRVYWQCVDGMKLQNQTCPGYLRYNASTEVCEHPSLVMCLDPLLLETLFPGLVRGPFAADHFPKAAMLPPSSGLPRLEGFESMFPNKDVTSGATKQRCDSGLFGYYAELTSSCRTFFHCTRDSTKKNYACPVFASAFWIAPPGLWEFPDSAQGNMIFNESSARCQDPNMSPCSSTRSRQLFPDIVPDQDFGVVLTSVVHPCRGLVGLFADVSTGCRHFIMCHLNGSFFNQTCPGGLMFNEKSSFCEWPFNVQCGHSVLSGRSFVAEISPSGGGMAGFTHMEQSAGLTLPSFGSFPSPAPRSIADNQAVSDTFFKNKADPTVHFPGSRFSSVQNYLDNQKASFHSKTQNDPPFIHHEGFIPDINRVHPGIVSTGFRPHPELTIGSDTHNVARFSHRNLNPGSQPYGPRPIIYDSYGMYYPRNKMRASTTTATTLLTTTAAPTTTGIPGMEEGEYEPEEGIVAPAPTTTAAPTTTLAPAPGQPRLMPLVMDASITSAPNTLNDAAVAGKVKNVDNTKSYGLDCLGKKGYFLSPGTGCKSYVFCKPNGAVYGFTCPGEYLYNAEKEICDWPENVRCLTGTSHSIVQPQIVQPQIVQPQAARWKRTLNADQYGSSHVFSCPQTGQYFADVTDNCLSFYYCSLNGSATKYECPDAKLKFDESRGVCDWGTRVKCGNETDVTETTFSSVAVETFQEAITTPGLAECPMTGFYAEYASSCRNFYFCGPGGERLNYSCPDGQEFDEYMERCENASTVLCTEQKISRTYGKNVRLVTRTRLISASGEASLDCRNRRGLFADPVSHCLNFFYCSPQGLKFEYSCPDNMAFNNAVNVCDEPSNSSCAVLP